MNKIVRVDVRGTVEEDVREEDTVEFLKQWEELFDGRAQFVALPMENGQIKVA